MPIPIRDVPTIYKERDPDESIFNEILLAQLPSIFPPQLIQDLLTAFRTMMADREGIPNKDKDSRSNLGGDVLHLGAWKKFTNPLSLTSDTTPESQVAQEATDAFLHKLEGVAEVLSLIVEEMCPRLMVNLHTYVSPYHLNISISDSIL
jgi:hypothetical protein